MTDLQLSHLTGPVPAQARQVAPLTVRQVAAAQANMSMRVCGIPYSQVVLPLRLILLT